LLVSTEEEKKFISNGAFCIKCNAADSRYNKVLFYLDRTQPKDEIILCEKCADIHFRDSEFKSKHLKIETSYTVIQEFSDFDNTLHVIGERWTYYGNSYDPTDNELILFIKYSDGEKGIFRMDLSNDEHQYVIKNFDKYIKIN